MLTEACVVAAVFFATYDGLKKALPGEGLINVMVAASVGEVVCIFALSSVCSTGKLTRI